MDDTIVFFGQYTRYMESALGRDRESLADKLVASIQVVFKTPKDLEKWIPPFPEGQVQKSPIAWVMIKPQTITSLWDGAPVKLVPGDIITRDSHVCTHVPIRKQTGALLGKVAHGRILPVFTLNHLIGFVDESVFRAGQIIRIASGVEYVVEDSDKG